MSTKDLRKRIPKSSIQAPLEALLGNDVSSNRDGLSGDREQCQHVPWQPVSLDTVMNAAKSARNQHAQLLNVPDPSEMFLNPGLASGTGKKAYLIPDFVSSKVVQDEDSSTIHLGENAKLSIVYGQRKPKLSDVTLSGWNAANMRILYKLIETKQLPTYKDVKSYLAYTIKINQLTGKYKWISILTYDEEFCSSTILVSIVFRFPLYALSSFNSSA